MSLDLVTISSVVIIAVMIALKGYLQIRQLEKKRTY